MSLGSPCQAPSHRLPKSQPTNNSNNNHVNGAHTLRLSSLWGRGQYLRSQPPAQPATELSPGAAGSLHSKSLALVLEESEKKKKNPLCPPCKLLLTFPHDCFLSAHHPSASAVFTARLGCPSWAGLRLVKLPPTHPPNAGQAMAGKDSCPLSAARESRPPVPPPTPSQCTSPQNTRHLHQSNSHLRPRASIHCLRPSSARQWVLSSSRRPERAPARITASLVSRPA